MNEAPVASKPNKRSHNQPSSIPHCPEIDDEVNMRMCTSGADNSIRTRSGLQLETIATRRDGSKQKPRPSINPRQRRESSGVTFDLGNLKIYDLPVTKRDKGARRMSAPELPPIARLPPTSMGFLTGKHGSYSHSRVKYKMRKHSESSSKGQTKSPLSLDASSSSSQGYILSLGPEENFGISRAKSWCTTDKSSGSIVKIKPTTERINGYVVSTHRTIIKAGDSYNRNANHPKLIHSLSETQISRDEAYIRPKSGFVRNNSNSKLTDKKNIRNSTLNNRTLSVERTQKLTQKSSAGNINGFRRYNSTFAINSQGGNSFSNDADNQTSNTERTNFDRTSSDPEIDKSQRIMQWLIGVDSDAEEPPEQDIDDDVEPPQTDTAVHIVYEEDE